jgi:hypothetical protein
VNVPADSSVILLAHALRYVKQRERYPDELLLARTILAQRLKGALRDLLRELGLEDGEIPEL